MKLFRLIFFILLIFCCSRANADTTVRRHYLVAVDCSGTFQKDDDKYILLNNFWNLISGTDVKTKDLNTCNINDLLNEKKSGMPFFDKNTDVISLYSFGMPGKMRQEIWNKYRFDKFSRSEDVYNMICSSFIFPVSPKSSEEKTSTNEIKRNFIKLFNDGQYNNLFRQNSQGITLSHFLYPCIISKISEDNPAEEYILVVFSDYKTGTSESDSEDIREIGYVLSKSALQKYLSVVSDLKSMFYRIDYFDFSKGKLSVKAFKLRPKAGDISENALLSIESSLNLQQKRFESDEYEIKSPLLLKFSRNDNFKADSIIIETSDGNKVINSVTIPYDNAINESNLQDIITIDNLALHFPNIRSANDFSTLTCKIEIIGNYSYKKGGMLPFRYSAQRTLSSEDIDFITPLSHIIFMIMIFLIFVLALMAIFAYFVFKGKKTKLSLYLDSDTNRFTEVSIENGTLSLACDFVTPNQREIVYTIKGRIERISKWSIPWMINYIYVKPVLTKSENISIDEIRVQGSDKPSRWNTLLVKENEFTFDLLVRFDSLEKTGNIEIQIQSKYSPYFLFIKGRGFDGNNQYRMLKENGLSKLNHQEYDNFLDTVHLEEESCQTCIKRFVRAGMDCPNMWVGIDPGTNGSCLTIGNSGIGSVKSPAIIPITDGKDSIIESLIIMGGLKDVTETIGGRQEKTKKPNFEYASRKELKEWEPQMDYLFGNKAKREIVSYIKNGASCFRSIKKLLGYKKTINVNIPETKENKKIDYKKIGFKGVDLQTLLVKGLIKCCMSEFIKEIKFNAKKRQDIFQNEDMCDIKNVRRAVVAVPNNFQLPQIVDMINSVKNTGCFDEVKYIYEPEGILFHYLSQTFKKHKDNGMETVIVFDMGGATINATVFKIVFEKRNTEEVFYKVSTLSRLGYAIGGDDIDYAILEFLMHFSCFSNLNDIERYAKQDEYKVELINLIQEFKVDFVKMCNNEPQDSLRNLNNFVDIYIKGILDIINVKSAVEDFLTEKEKNFYTGDLFKDRLKEKLQSSLWLKKYLYAKLEDAIKDMLATKDIENLSSINKIIYSGRSTLFPKVKEHIRDFIHDKGFSPEEHKMNATEVKTAVARGACWFGMYDGKVIEVDNSRITSSYGIRHTIPEQTEYIEIIPQNSKYENGSLTKCANISSNFANNGCCVQFYQVMGAANQDIFEPSKSFKVRYLASIALDGRTVTQETITVNADGRVSCNVNGSRLQRHVLVNYDTRDITNDNDRPYLFSIYNN